MSTELPMVDPTLDRLRRAHRSERVPGGLRRRALERARQLSSQSARRASRNAAWPWRAGSALLAGAALLAAGLGLTWRPDGDAPTRGDHAISLRPEPAATSATPANPCPVALPSSPWDPMHLDLGMRHAGLTVQLVETQTNGCGPLDRRYLSWVPEATPLGPPVLIALHDGGHNPAELQIATRWYLDDLARREKIVLVYANGVPLPEWYRTEVHAGRWQTDEGAHPKVDDHAYLQAIVDDLRRRRVIGVYNEIFLTGYGSGAVMALAAAARHPERYSGVAAFLPTQPIGDIEALPGAKPDRERRLHWAFIALHDPARPVEAEATPHDLAQRWGAGLGSARMGPVVVRSRGARGQQIDTTLGGPSEAPPSVTGRSARGEPGYTALGVPNGIALRILRLTPEGDPFPLPGGGDPDTRAASEANPNFLDGVEEAWAFFHEFGAPP